MGTSGERGVACWARHETWGGLRRGDAVVVDSPRERRRPFTFVAYVESSESGAAWVEVRGASGQDQRTRSFRPELICPVEWRRGRRSAGPPVIDAPRLPF